MCSFWQREMGGLLESDTPTPNPPALSILWYFILFHIQTKYCTPFDGMFAFDIFLEPQFYGWGEPQYIWGVYNQYSHKHGARRGVVSTAYPECEDVARFDGWVRLCQPAHHWWSPGYNTRHTSFLMEAKYENNMSCYKRYGIRYGWYQGGVRYRAPYGDKNDQRKNALKNIIEHQRTS